MNLRLVLFAAAIGLMACAPKPVIDARFEFKNGKQGWGHENAIDNLRAEDGELRFTITDEDAYIFAPRLLVSTTEKPFIVIRMRQPAQQSNQIYWATDVDPDYGENKRISFDGGMGGEYSTHIIDMRGQPGWDGNLISFRIDIGITELGEAAIDYVRVLSEQELDPKPVITEFTATDQVCQPLGTPFPLTCTIKNDGGQLLANPEVQLDLPDGVSIVEQGAPMTQHPGLPAQDTFTQTWQLQADTPVAGEATVAITYPGLESVTARTRLYVLPEPVREAVSSRVTQTDSGVVLQNNRMRATFPLTDLGYGSILLDARKNDDWYPMAMVPGFSLLNIDHGAGLESTVLNAREVAIEDESACFTGTYTDDDEHAWSYSFRFTLPDNSTMMDVSYTLTASTDESLCLFEGPMLYAGAESFGSAKHEALLPGLEWLIDDEVSSNQLDITSADYLRYVPHPQKITVPVIGMVQDGVALGIMWEPMTPWHGDAVKPSIVFAAPDRFEGKDASLFGVFVPSVPEYVKENERTARRKAYPLPAGETVKLKTTIIVDNEATDAPALTDHWFDRYGAPEPMPLPRNRYQDELALCMEAYMKTLWMPEEKQWQVFSRFDKGGPFDVQCRGWEPMMCLELATRLTDNPKKADAYRARYDEVLAADGDAGGFDLPFLSGDPIYAAAGLGSYSYDLAKDQWDDGSWRFDATPPIKLMPDKTMAYLGEHEAGASGLTASPTRHLLHYARLTGDPEALEKGLKGLEALKQFRVPRAAQLWEIPLHAPDILASAYAVSAYVDGYRLTGDKSYLDEAVRWARTGLPFVYVWNVPEYDHMRYATTPIFGATFYNLVSWLGRPVQWCGLDYAYAILELDGLDDTHDWRSIAEGILISGLHEVGLEPDVRGTFPDAYSVLDGSIGPPYINPSRMVMVMAAFMGLDPRTETIFVPYGERRVHVSSGASLLEMTQESGSVSFIVSGRAGETTMSLLANIDKPVEVTVDGVAVPEVDEEFGDEITAWRYDGNLKMTGLAAIRIPHTGSAQIVKVSF